MRPVQNNNTRTRLHRQHAFPGGRKRQGVKTVCRMVSLSDPETILENRQSKNGSPRLEPDQRTAIHRQADAIDVAGRVAGKEYRCHANVHRIAHLFHGDPSQDLLETRGIVIRRLVEHGCLDPSRCNGIDAHAPPVRILQPGHGPNPGTLPLRLRIPPPGAVRYSSSYWPGTEYYLLLRLHMWYQRLGQCERTHQMHIEYLLIIFTVISSIVFLQ